MIKAVNDQYGQYLPKLLTEKSSLEEINEAYSIINTSIKEQIALKIKNSATDEIVTSGLKEQVSAVSEIRKSLTSRVKNVGLVDSIVDEIKQTTDEFQKAGSTWEKSMAAGLFQYSAQIYRQSKIGERLRFFNGRLREERFQYGASCFYDRKTICSFYFQD